jgi:hypothetical protein
MVFVIFEKFLCCDLREIFMCDLREIFMCKYTHGCIQPLYADYD